MSRRRPSYRVKACAVCGAEFIPNSGAQKWCRPGGCPKTDEALGAVQLELAEKEAVARQVHVAAGLGRQPVPGRWARITDAEAAAWSALAGAHGLAILVALRMHAGADEAAWPSLPTVAAVSGVGLTKTKKVVRSARLAGLVEVVKIPRSRPGRPGNLYRLSGVSVAGRPKRTSRDEFRSRDDRSTVAGRPGTGPRTGTTRRRGEMDGEEAVGGAEDETPAGRSETPPPQAGEVPGGRRLATQVRDPDGDPGTSSLGDSPRGGGGATLATRTLDEILAEVTATYRVLHGEPAGPEELRALAEIIAKEERDRRQGVG